ncbi:transcription factor TFIID-domain-containing protein [Tribonema minus]|uniref:Transcription factor TFIID-domain-containing protein n=1 Tax=Tribonema minus TaxID=303371 RepID=A0A835Z195_9STRA|nr:transcription factor TFIID-domain-containing protein [Tribonema minus]
MSVQASQGWSHTSGIILRQQNVTASLNVGQRLELKALHAAAKTTIEYNPKRQPQACVMRLRTPPSTAILYPSGKMIVTGCLDTEDAQVRFRVLRHMEAANKFVRMLSAIVSTLVLKTSTVAIQNIVVACKLGFRLDLERLHYEHTQHASYEPELYPAVVFRLEQPKVVFMMFAEGRVVMTGAKTVLVMQRAFDVMYPLLAEYRKA